MEFRTPAVAQKYKQLLDGKMMGGKALKTSEVKGELFFFSSLGKNSLRCLLPRNCFTCDMVRTLKQASSNHLWRLCAESFSCPPKGLCCFQIFSHPNACRCSKVYPWRAGQPIPVLIHLHSFIVDRKPEKYLHSYVMYRHLTTPLTPEPTRPQAYVTKTTRPCKTGNT